MGFKSFRPPQVHLQGRVISPSSYKVNRSDHRWEIPFSSPPQLIPGLDRREGCTLIAGLFSMLADSSTHAKPLLPCLLRGNLANEDVRRRGEGRRRNSTHHRGPQLWLVAEMPCCLFFPLSLSLLASLPASCLFLLCLWVIPNPQTL